MAFWAQHARPQELRPTPIGARIHAESGQGLDVAEIICLVTVTCDGNGAAARPAMIPTGACGGSGDSLQRAFEIGVGIGVGKAEIPLAI